MNRIPILLIILLAATLGACSSSRIIDISQDSAPNRHVDVSAIPDARPVPVIPSEYGNPQTYEVNGRVYRVMESSNGFVERGTASWYGTKFHGRATSSGEPYNMYAMTAAHKTLPLPTFARVTNLDNGRSIVVKINDRGPFVDGRIIDLSYVAAKKLGITGRGTGHVEVQAIQAQPPAANTRQLRQDHRTVDATNPLYSNLYLQVGIFSTRDNAEKLRQQLLQLPLPEIHVIRDTSLPTPRYRVKIGPLNSDNEADQVIDMLASQGHTGFRIRID